MQLLDRADGGIFAEIARIGLNSPEAQKLAYAPTKEPNPDNRHDHAKRDQGYGN
jgi:hypothetical protein